MESYQYTAFISYRHIHPDMEIAKQLHGMIENYHIPKSVQKLTNIQKMGRVFRDQEELPISTNLGEDIHRALENSQWLIVICTPELLKSAWCMKEIDTFIQLGKRDHILAILLKGEPEESFPTQLRTVIKNGIEEAIEPLAADVRGDTLSESLKKLRKEKLRLIARIREGEWTVARTEQYIDALSRQTPPKKQLGGFLLRDVRVFFNSVEHQLELIRSAGIDAGSEKEETEQEIILTIRIPKKVPVGKA